MKTQNFEKTLRETPIFEREVLKYNGKQITGFRLNPDDEIIGIKPSLKIPNTTAKDPSPKLSDAVNIYAARIVKLGMIVKFINGRICILTSYRKNGRNYAFWGVPVFKNKI